MPPGPPPTYCTAATRGRSPWQWAPRRGCSSPRCPKCVLRWAVLRAAGRLLRLAAGRASHRDRTGARRWPPVRRRCQPCQLHRRPDPRALPARAGLLRRGGEVRHPARRRAVPAPDRLRVRPPRRTGNGGRRHPPSRQHPAQRPQPRHLAQRIAGPHPGGAGVPPRRVRSRHRNRHPHHPDRHPAAAATWSAPAGGFPGEVWSTSNWAPPSVRPAPAGRPPSRYGTRHAPPSWRSAENPTCASSA